MLGQIAPTRSGTLRDPHFSHRSLLHEDTSSSIIELAVWLVGNFVALSTGNTPTGVGKT